MERVAEKKRDKKAKARQIDDHLEEIFSETAVIPTPVTKTSQEKKNLINSRKVNTIFLVYHLWKFHFIRSHNKNLSVPT